MDFLGRSKTFEHLTIEKLDLEPVRDPASNPVIHPDLAHRRVHHETGGQIHAPPITGVILIHRTPEVTRMRNVVRDAGCNWEVNRGFQVKQKIQCPTNIISVSYRCTPQDKHIAALIA